MEKTNNAINVLDRVTTIIVDYNDNSLNIIRKQLIDNLLLNENSEFYLKVDMKSGTPTFKILLNLVNNQYFEFDFATVQKKYFKNKKLMLVDVKSAPQNFEKKGFNLWKEV